LVDKLNFKHIQERYRSDAYNFVIGKINLQNLIDNQELIADSKAFVAFADQLSGVKLVDEVKVAEEIY
jgi:homoserine dehydrogenase